MNNIYRRLDEIDWDFSDYISSLYPNDINSIHWYPASFVPQLPSMLTQILSKEGDVLLEPFMGSGITIIEALKLNRIPIGIDINPYSFEITKAKLDAIQFVNSDWKDNEISNIKNLTLIDNVNEFVLENNVDIEVTKWFDIQTLKELITIYNYIIKCEDQFKSIRKIIFSSILNKCSSQRDHYTYITDRCYPKSFTYYNALEKYIIQIEEVTKSTTFYREHYFRLHKNNFNPSQVLIKNASSVDLGWLNDSTIDIIVTSPPYLGVNDYIRSIRLTSLFFSVSELDNLINNEIGARRKRNRRNAFDEYISEMKLVFTELNRVLKTKKYLCLVIGQSSGKVIKENIIDIFLKILINELHFQLIFKKARHIKFRRIQVSGVGYEWIIVLKSNK